MQFSAENHDKNSNQESIFFDILRKKYKDRRQFFSE